MSRSLPKVPVLRRSGSPLGLSIDATSVRIVELNDKGTALRALGDVPLPSGAVSAGEIHQPDVVGQAVSQLLSAAGVSGRRVDLALSSPRIALRLLEVPEMPEAELQTSLAFQVGDLLPIPAADMIIDYQPVGYLEGADGKRSRQILVIAGHRDHIKAYLDVTRTAGLHVRTIDSAPLALARSLRELLAPYDPASGSAPVEAVVQIGADVTNIVVTAGGTTMFGRTLAAGADPFAHDSSGDPSNIADRLFPLMEDVRNTLAFAISQVARERLSRVLLVTDPNLEPVLVECLQATLGVPVQPVWVAHVADVRGISGADTVDGTFAIPFALAANRFAATTEHTPSLLPGEIGVEAAKRRQKVLVAAGAVAAVGGLALLTVSHNQAVAAAQAAATAAQKTQARELTRLASLQDVQQTINATVARRSLVQAQLAGSIDYLHLINDIADHLPKDVTLEALALSKEEVLSLSLHGDGEDSPSRTLESFSSSQRFGDSWIDTVTWVAPADDPANTAIAAAPQESTSFATFTIKLKITPAAASGRASEFEVTK